MVMSEQENSYRYIATDTPRSGVLRITLNRPDKRNAMSNPLRCELFGELERADTDASVRVIIIRGAGSSFCAGYDMTADLDKHRPYHTAGGLGSWPRHVTDGCFRIWDLAKPVIAQVHGYCLAGGTELATACDLVYVGESARIGYPVVRSISPPDNQFYPWVIGMRRAMEMMLTGDAITGEQAVEYGFANRLFSDDDLELGVLDMAERVAKLPSDLQQMNKRAVHRQMDAMGMRAALRAGTEMQILAMFTESSRAHVREIQAGLTGALTKRDQEFGDYRTSGKS